jgi:hypothetical protein
MKPIRTAIPMDLMDLTVHMMDMVLMDPTALMTGMDLMVHTMGTAPMDPAEHRQYRV